MRNVTLVVFMILGSIAFAEDSQIANPSASPDGLVCTFTNTSTFQYFLNTEDGTNYTEYFPLYNVDTLGIEIDEEWMIDLSAYWNLYSARNADNTTDAGFAFNGVGIQLGKSFLLEDRDRLRLSTHFIYYFQAENTVLSDFFSIPERPVCGLTVSLLSMEDPLVNSLSLYTRYLFPSDSEFTDDQLTFGASCEEAVLMNDASAIKLSLDLSYSLWNNTPRNLPSGGFSATFSCSILALLEQENSLQMEAGYSRSLSNPLATGRFFTGLKSDVTSH